MGYAARITGTGSAFPERRMTNDDVARKLTEFGLETSDQWIQERTGIVERRISNVGNEAERNSSLAARAAIKALEMAGRQAEEIDQIIYATCSPDTPLPSTACWLQQKIGAHRAWVMDINAACSGFIYGVVTAEQFIRSGHSRTVLVIGAEVLSHYINWQDRTICILFGDGAGAAVVERVAPRSRRRVLASYLSSDGTLSELLIVPAGGSALEVTPERYAQNLHKIRMSGREIFKVAVRTLSECALRTLEQARIPAVKLDWFVPHQANLRIIEAVANRIGMSMDQVIINLDRYGNTSAATIPTALDEAIRDGRIKEGQTVLTDAFGAGLTAGAMVFRR
ncbi:MAG: ketoacyl-ACP synthase III [Deltaproteobacteria bacterium]|nr:ketoacyl-ACP synthase III [Deltaproteobacteria bacterium]MBW2479148.1 ketoacyl-ACP synthase III [Deltaproteobacteria bacterium]